MKRILIFALLLLAFALPAWAKTTNWTDGDAGNHRWPGGPGVGDR